MSTDAILTFAQSVTDKCLAAGADHAEVYVRQGVESEIQVRNGEIEQLQSGSPKSVGIRVWREDRVASTFSSDFSDDAITRLVGETVTLAALTDPIPELALPEANWLVDEVADLELFDEKIAALSPEARLKMIRTAERVALDYDPRITVSQGASYGDLDMKHALVNSAGFARGYRESYVSYNTVVIADDADNKKRRGYWYSVGRHLDQLLDPEEVGRVAGERTVSRIGASPMTTGKVPVVFDPLAGSALVGLLFSVLSGSAIERRSSYLIDRVGEAIAANIVSIVDDPTIVRGSGSRPYDGEGLPARRTEFIKDGVLTGYALNAYTARKLGLAPTGHASRPSSGSPGVKSSNLFMASGASDPAELIAGIEYGLYCDSMMGFGFNAATGDFSRGAAGFLIENGKLTRPVSEITVSSNFKDLFMNIDAVANDLKFDRSTTAPTFRVSEMTVAGQ